MISNPKFKFVWLYLISKQSILWEVGLTRAIFGDAEIDLSVLSASFDTGSSLIYMPQTDFKQVFDLVNRDNKNMC